MEYFITTADRKMDHSTPSLSIAGSLSSRFQSGQQKEEVKKKEGLPKLKMKRMLVKIGASASGGMLTRPDPVQLLRAWKNKERQLREQLRPVRKNERLFEGQLDEIVLGCWHPNRVSTHKSVWAEYKQNSTSLMLDTLKVLHKKRL